MSKITSRKCSDGDIQRNPQSNGRSSFRKTRNKPMKSNITSKMKTRRSEVVASNGVQDEDDEGDSSATEDQDDTAEDPNVPALPGVRRKRGGETAKRLAGRNLEQDMFTDIGTTDDAQTMAGADEQDYEGSDEDGYEDVENVSDEEDPDDEIDERSVLRSAEQDLIDEFERTEQHINAKEMTNDMTFMALDEEQALARRLSLQETSDSQTDDFGFPINMNQDPFYGYHKDGDTYRTMWDEAETALWRMPETVRSRESTDPASATQKRVRFEEIQVDSSSESESEDPNETFPDLLNVSDVNTLKQSIALGLELELGLDHNGFNDADSFYDFEDEDERLAFQVDEESDSDDDASSYNSADEGDTTDEESREEQIARMKERKKAMAKASNDADSKHRPGKPAIHNAARTLPSPSTSRPTTPKSSKALKFGTFALDPTRATMTTDSDGKKIKLLPPATPLEKDKAFWDRAKTANNSRDGSPGNSFLTMPTPGADAIPDRPFTTESTLGLMFQGNLDILRNNDINGFPDDLLATTMMNSQTSFVSTATMDHTDETDEEDINMQDFLDLDDSDSDTNETLAGVLASPDAVDMLDTFMKVNTSNIREPGLLDHFDRCGGAIGSFRRNQHQAKHVSSLPSNPAKRASAHEYNALQKGRRGAANTPMTPARKKRVSQDLTSNGAGVRKSIGSPLTARRPRSRGNSLAGVSASNLYQTLARNPFD